MTCLSFFLFFSVFPPKKWCCSVSQHGRALALSRYWSIFFFFFGLLWDSWGSPFLFTLILCWVGCFVSSVRSLMSRTLRTNSCTVIVLHTASLSLSMWQCSLSQGLFVTAKAIAKFKLPLFQCSTKEAPHGPLFLFSTNEPNCSFSHLSLRHIILF